jgi:hypothetical protein
MSAIPGSWIAPVSPVLFALFWFVATSAAMSDPLRKLFPSSTTMLFSSWTKVPELMGKPFG